LEIAFDAVLICHCNVLTSQEIEGIIREFLRADPWAIIVPTKVYRALGRRGRCCGCFPNVVDIIGEVTQKHHLELAEAAKSGVATTLAGRATHSEEH
jgi:hypothetical protein